MSIWYKTPFLLLSETLHSHCCEYMFKRIRSRSITKRLERYIWYFHIWFSFLVIFQDIKYQWFDFQYIFSVKAEGGEDQETSNGNSTTFYEEKMFCHHCDDSLAGHRYVLRDDHPYCIKCYENVFANNCDECGKIIGIDSKVPFLLVSWQDLLEHVCTHRLQFSCFL